MEPQYLFTNGFRIALDSIRIGNIVLLENEVAAEVFFAKIFPHFTECLVGTADGKYPQDPALRQHLLNQLATNDKLAVVLFSSDTYRKFNILSQRILVLDRYLADSFSRAKIRAPFRREINEFEIVQLLVHFFDQWRIFHRAGNTSHHLRSNSEFESGKAPWLFDLIAPKEATPHARILEYHIENHESLIFNYKPSGKEGLNDRV